MNDYYVRLQTLAEPEYREFSMKLNPGITDVLGVRVPLLRELAKEIARGDEWRDYLNDFIGRSLEERMLYGMVIGYVRKLPLPERLQWVSRFVPLINCWSVCDSVSSTYKFAAKERETVLGFLQHYLWAGDERPYSVRFAVIMLMDYYIDCDYIGRLLEIYEEIKSEEYYVQMAVAWALSVCYVKFPEETLPLLQRHTLSSFVQNKTIQKICESYRVENNEKLRIKKLRVPNIP